MSTTTQANAKLLEKLEIDLRLKVKRGYISDFAFEDGYIIVDISKVPEEDRRFAAIRMKHNMINCVGRRFKLIIIGE